MHFNNLLNRFKQISFEKVAILITVLSFPLYQNCSFEAMQDTQQTQLTSQDPTPYIPDDGPIQEKIEAFKSRPLTNNEYDNSVMYALGDTQRRATLNLPSDLGGGDFDTSSNKELGAPTIRLYFELANQIAQSFVTDPQRMTTLLGCNPTNALTQNRDTCLDTTIDRLGRRILSRTISVDEKNNLRTFISEIETKTGSQQQGVQALIAALLQSPEFLFFIPFETIPTNEAEIQKLNSLQFAKRLSLALISQIPDEELIEAAQSGELDTTEGLDKQINRLLQTEAARNNILRFHSLWLKYFSIEEGGGAGDDMKMESDSLIRRHALDENGDWTNIFLSDETFINRNLADRYGMNVSQNDFAWVKYTNNKRRGILSHASFLSNGFNAEGTSTVRRGKIILENVLCRAVPKPPPNVNADEPPPQVAGANCKIDRVIAYSPPGSSCFSCHKVLDPVGFGFEQFDNFGTFREQEPNKPACEIDGAGELPQQNDFAGGSFNGPADFANMVVSSGEVQSCMVKKFYTYATGDDNVSVDNSLVQKMARSLKDNDHSLLKMIKATVKTNEFKFIKVGNE